MEALTLHEAVPGHHLQIALAQELEGLPEFRKNTSYTAFVEGWALYAESLGDEMGFYTGSVLEVRPAHLRDVARRAARRRHRPALDGLDAPAGDRLLRRQRRQDRCRTSPSRSIATSSGRVRRSATRWASSRSASCARTPSAQLGPKFDVRAFHDVVLGQGAVPLDVLERRLQSLKGGLGRASAACHRADDEERLAPQSRRHRAAERRATRATVLLAGKEPDERPALLGHVVADRPAKHRVPALRARREPRAASPRPRRRAPPRRHVRERPQMRR